MSSPEYQRHTGWRTVRDWAVLIVIFVVVASCAAGLVVAVERLVTA